jgi:hypothetical protein
MHLHWKYRELVKIISKESNIEAVHEEARTLEAESGGILVGVERVNKGYAIIMYRGKNYKRPASLRPQTLLSKREAMKRSIEAQRRKVKLARLSLYVYVCQPVFILSPFLNTKKGTVKFRKKPPPILIRKRDSRLIYSIIL